MQPQTYFENYIKQLFSELINIDSYFELWMHLNNRQQDRLNEMNFAPAFFQIVKNSLLQNTIISLARFFDSYKYLERSDKNLVRFINFVESNLNIFPNDELTLKRHRCDYKVDGILIQKHRKLIEDLHPILDNLFAWRDKFYAHFDSKYFLENNKLGKDYSIKVRDIRNLIKTAATILNEYSAVYNGSVNIIRASNLTDIDNILELLHNKLAPE